MADPGPAPRRGSGDARDRAPGRYRRYRAAPRLLRRHDPIDPAELRSLRSESGGAGRPRLPGGLRLPRRGRPPRGRRLTWRRALLGVLLAIVAWIALSLVLFLISDWTQTQGVDAAAQRALDGGGVLPFSTNTILVLGSDQRPKGSHEPGASTSGPSRSDVILLIRVGGGASSRLSIPRDTVVEIPGYGLHKINAAFAFGGAALAIKTIKQYLGIKINHVVEVNFGNFPQLIDAMGGIDYKSGCILARIDGGFSRGGYTVNLKPGTHHIDGKEALAIARTRHNQCRPGESDLTRAKHQQQLFTAMKSRLLSFSGFIRLPWIAWNAPPALVTDMGGPTLLGVFSALATSGSPAPRILIPSGVAYADGGVGLTVSDAQRHAAVQRFLKG